MKLKKILNNNSLLAGSAVMIFGSLGVNAINYFYHIVMGRLLGPADYGELISLYAILYIISVAPMSTSYAIVKEISRAKNKKERSIVYYSLRRYLWRFAIASSIFFVFMSPIIAHFLHIEGVFSTATVGFTLFFMLVLLEDQAALQGTLNFFGVVASNLASSLIKLIFGVIFIVLGLSVPGAMMAILLAVVASYCVASLMVRGVISTRPPKKEIPLAPFLKFAFPVLLQALAFVSLMSTDIILVKHFLSPKDAGLYGALSTLGKIIYFAAQPVTAVMFPLVSGRKSRGEHYRHIFYASFVLTLLISSCVVFIYYLIPHVAIGILYGGEYLEAKSELVWMGLFITFYTASYLVVNFLLSINRVKIVILPLVASIAQIVMIWSYHVNLLAVIKSSLTISILLFLSLGFYLANYQFRLMYANKKS